MPILFYRSFSDIPFASKVAEILDAERITADQLVPQGLSPKDVTNGAPFAEARYKSIRSQLERSDIKQIIEFGSGFSFRGLAMAQDREIIYVETDLQEINVEKQRVIAALPEAKCLLQERRVFFETANILSMSETTSALKHFATDKSVAIVHEGVLPYLYLDEKKVAACNIRDVLRRFGGVWITPDLHTREGEETFTRKLANSVKAKAAVTNATKRSFMDTAFDDDEHIFRFFRELGSRPSLSHKLTGASRSHHSRG